MKGTDERIKKAEDMRKLKENRHNSTWPKPCLYPRCQLGYGIGKDFPRHPQQWAFMWDLDSRHYRNTGQSGDLLSATPPDRAKAEGCWTDLPVEPLLFVFWFRTNNRCQIIKRTRTQAMQSLQKSLWPSAQHSAEAQKENVISSERVAVKLWHFFSPSGWGEGR